MSYNELKDWEDLLDVKDLQLAAELGKTLLERNKELESNVRQQQAIIDDQNQKIVFLQKKNDALQEVNEARIKIYSDVEAGIAEQDREIYRLSCENSNFKTTIKRYQENIEQLESKIDDLGKLMDDTKRLLQTERRKNDLLVKEKLNNEQLNSKQISNEDKLSRSEYDVNFATDGRISCLQNTLFDPDLSDSSSSLLKLNSTGFDENVQPEDFSLNQIGSDEIMPELDATKQELDIMRQRCTDLEDQLNSINEENQGLRVKIAQNNTNEDLKSVSFHDELSILDEVRQGQMCSRCLRSFDDRILFYDESSLAPTEDDEDQSLHSYLDIDSDSQMCRTSIKIKMSESRSASLDFDPLIETCRSPNIYRELVEKYEALLEVHKQVSPSVSPKNLYCTNELSLAQELRQTENQQQSQSRLNVAKNVADEFDVNTKTSETGTLSSGFCDETSTKQTQTDAYSVSFLCSIGDTDEKFYIYDDTHSMDLRFRNRPEYRELFKEIFAVLRRAAENKEEGEKLPLLDDQVLPTKMPLVIPPNEQTLSELRDETQSVGSSVISEQSIAMSECITKRERKTAKKHINKDISDEKELSHSASKVQQKTIAISPIKDQIIEDGKVLTPYKRSEPLEFLQVGVGLRKKNRRKNRNFSSSLDRSESPIALPSPPRVFITQGRGKKRRGDKKTFQISPLATHSAGAGSSLVNHEWDGNSMIIYNKKHQSLASSRNPVEKISESNAQYKPSVVSENFQKLKKLDLSYAEVLRRSDSCKHHYKKKLEHNNPKSKNQN